MRLSFTIVLLITHSVFVIALEPQKGDESQELREQSQENGGVICEPFGTCESCPESELDEPFCQPFGNRRLLHCRTPGLEGETPAWGSCGRIVAKERADFFEFVACNIAFAVIGLLAVLARSRRQAYRRARTLAARIAFSRTLPPRNS